MIILVAALVFAIAWWAVSARSDLKSDKVAVRVRSDQPKKRGTRVIND